MARFTVYHAKNPTFGFPGAPAPTWPQDFACVARVEADDLEATYRLTNSIQGYWGDHRGVQTMGGPHRSTSVGDVVVAPDGTTWQCATAGWERVGGDGQKGVRQ